MPPDASGSNPGDSGAKRMTMQEGESVEADLEVIGPAPRRRGERAMQISLSGPWASITCTTPAGWWAMVLPGCAL